LTRHTISEITGKLVSCWVRYDFEKILLGDVELDGYAAIEQNQRGKGLNIFEKYLSVWVHYSRDRAG
jgi:hypothetical protein